MSRISSLENRYMVPVKQKVQCAINAYVFTVKMPGVKHQLIFLLVKCERSEI